MTIVILLLLNGCSSTLSTVKTTTVFVNSDPTGASIYLYDANTYQETLLGTTPGNFDVPQGKLWVFLLAKIDGYESVKEMITSQKTNYEIKLEKDWTGQILGEYLSEKYSKEFIKQAINVVGTFNRALNSPRMLFASVYSEGETELSQLNLDFPEMRTTALMRALQKCRLDMYILTVAVAGSLEHTPWEWEKILELELLISKIKNSLLY